MIDRIRLQKVFDDLPHKTLAVVGDLFLDQYLQLDSTLTETSIETGLSAYQVEPDQNSGISRRKNMRPS